MPSSSPISDADSSLLDRFHRPLRSVVSMEALTEQRHRAVVGSFVALLSSLQSLNGVLESLNTSLKSKPDSWDDLSDALTAPWPFEDEPLTFTQEPPYEEGGLAEIFRRDRPTMHEASLFAVA